MDTGLDLHPDVVRAINSLANTKLGQRFDRMAQKRYGVSGKVLAAKQITGESGGRGDAVSSAGARGVGQFMPGTRQEFIRKYGIDPWRSPKEAVRALEMYDLQRGVAGYNPGMPTYTNYVLGQKLSGGVKQALGGGELSFPGPTSHTVTQQFNTTPGVSFADERRQAADNLLLSGKPLSLDRLLDYKRTLDSLADIPATRTPAGIKVTQQRGAGVTVPGRRTSGGRSGSEVLELIHNDGGRGYGIKNGKVVNGAQVFADVWAGHANHVHVAAGPKTVVALGKLAQRMGLRVSENPHFGGVNPAAHVKGSYHDIGEAIDVSGDPRKMDAFSRAVERYNKTRRLPR